MDEKTRDLFAEMLGGHGQAASVNEAPAPAAETVADNEAEVASADVEPADAKPVETEKPSERDAGGKPATDSPREFPRKDLGVGGASFCDEILKHATPEILAKLKSGEKTMAGCWNWVYSFVRNEYIRQHGRESGGMWMDCGRLVERYFAEIPEGTVCEEEKPKPLPVPAAAASDAATVVKTAKRAARRAKKEAKAAAQAKSEDSSASPESAREEDAAPSAPKIKIDFSKIFARY